MRQMYLTPVTEWRHIRQNPFLETTFLRHSNKREVQFQPDLLPFVLYLLARSLTLITVIVSLFIFRNNPNWFFSLLVFSVKFLVDTESCVQMLHLPLPLRLFIPGNLICISVTVLVTSRYSSDWIRSDGGCNGNGKGVICIWVPVHCLSEVLDRQQQCHTNVTSTIGK